MPYIDPKVRPKLDALTDPLIDHIGWLQIEEQDGVVDYVVTRMLMSPYRPPFFNFNRALAVLSAITQEFYRVVVAQYEDEKIREFGAVKAKAERATSQEQLMPMALQIPPAAAPILLARTESVALQQLPEGQNPQRFDAHPVSGVGYRQALSGRSAGSPEKLVYPHGVLPLELAPRGLTYPPVRLGSRSYFGERPDAMALW